MANAALVHHVASCHNCDFHVDARNAMGVGSQHAQKRGHHVGIELAYSVRATGLLGEVLE